MGDVFRQGAFKQGEHICALYETEQEQIAVAAAYLADGLRAGERVLYVGASEPALERFRTALASEGIDVPAADDRGALIQATHAQAHLAGGGFNSERMMRLLNQALDSALNDGFAGLRTCGDMSWLREVPAGASQIIEYEALLNRFFAGVRGAGMCQYDRCRLPPEIIDHALATHMSATLDGEHVPNLFYQSPESAMTRTAQPGEVNGKVNELRCRARARSREPRATQRGPVARS